MPAVQGRTVILTDDGLATGTTMRAAATALRQLKPLRIIVAVPVGAAETCEEFRTEVDEVVCAASPEPFMAVGAWYSEFSQTSDDEVRELLRRAASYRANSSPLVRHDDLRKERKLVCSRTDDIVGALRRCSSTAHRRKRRLRSVAGDDRRRPLRVARRGFARHA